jgi:hypothetical protein
MKFLNNLKRVDISSSSIVARQAEKGVRALSEATPRDSGLSASSWGYSIQRTKTSLTIYWTNNDVENGYPVAFMIQHGHGTGTGGYVQGIDYINPAMRPVFDEIAEAVWKAVISA